MAYFYTYNAIRLNANQHIAALQGSFTAAGTGGGDPIYPYEPITGNVIYVATNGDDSRTRAQAANSSTPWRTVQKAADNVVAGDNVVVKDGVYTRNTSEYLVAISKSGTAQNPIRFVSENKWGAVLDGNYQNHSPIAINNSSHIVFEGFDIRRGRFGGVWANSNSPGASSITIRGNWIHDIGNDGQTYNDQLGRAGVFTGFYARHFHIEGNAIARVGRTPGGTSWEHYDHGIYATGFGHNIINNVIFEHNLGWHVKLDGSARLRTDEVGTKYAGGAQGTAGSFIHPWDERSFLFLNNTLAGQNTHSQYVFSSMTLSTNEGNAPRNVLVMNNVFWNPRNGGIQIGVGSGGTWEGLEIVNNITDADTVLYPTPGYGASLGQFNCGSSCDFRVYANNIDNGTNPGIKGTALGMVSPKNTGATAGDFRLTGSATLIIDRGVQSYNPNRNGLATVFPPNHDYDNLPRPIGVGFDKGAFEYRS